MMLSHLAKPSAATSRESPRRTPRTSPLSLAYGSQSGGNARFGLTNLWFFRLSQCANTLHKTGTKAAGGLANYLKASWQSLDGVVGRLEADGLVVSGPDPTNEDLDDAAPAGTGR